MIPGEHIVIIGQPEDATGVRASGLQLRDTLLILLPGPRELFAYLFRAPLEGTVAENVLRYSVGGINIDGCRVACDSNPSIPRREISRRTGTVPIPGGKAANAQVRGRIERRGSAETYKMEHPGENLGRWPTNLVLVHGPGCVRSGEKKIKSSSFPTVSSPTVLGVINDDGWKPKPTYHSGFADSDGTETVAAWSCQPDCPVRLLDKQSFDRRIHPAGNLRSVTGSASAKGYQANAYGKESRTEGTEHLFYSDAGGASRFYPQFSNLTEALDWLTRLIGA